MAKKQKRATSIKLEDNCFRSSMGPPIGKSDKSMIRGCDLMNVKVIVQAKAPLKIKIAPDGKLLKDMTIREVLFLADRLRTEVE